MVMEFGILILEILIVIRTKANIWTIKKTDLDYINGKMGQHIKDNFWTIWNTVKELWVTLMGAQHIWNGFKGILSNKNTKAKDQIQINALQAIKIHKKSKNRKNNNQKFTWQKLIKKITWNQRWLEGLLISEIDCKVVLFIYFINMALIFLYKDDFSCERLKIIKKYKPTIFNKWL